MRNAVTLEAEIKQVRIAKEQGYPSLQLNPLKEETLCVVGYGPSLENTWKEVTHPFLTVSGAHDFMQDRGMIPDFHCECDGRDHKTKHLERANKETVYLMATICCPRMWELLKGCKVVTWHNANGQHIVDWIAKNDDCSILVAGGSNIGLSSLHIAGILGYRKFKVFGFDGNLKDGKRHAGPHYGPPQKVIEHLGWQTTPQMFNACEEFLWLSKDPGLSLEVVGDSLLKTMFDGRIL